MNRVEFRQRILAANDAQAAVLRQHFSERNMLVVDLVSSPGAGKTALLGATAQRLAGSARLATVVGDIATELDAERLRATGMPAHQIVTGGACHLDARLVAEALERAPFGDVDLLFIENVGNLVCPASYALGEDYKVALLSVTEGHDKPFKYPAIFARAAVTLITKTDLLPHVDFDVEIASDQIRTLNSDAQVLSLSTRSGEGMEEWCTLLRTRMDERRPKRAAV
jgi:hydrogenase nickel incorporation protein HypB